ncbi:hypothetical protein HI914_03897 [Erysiphe necator]|nr:hypothetical protein HI914_03897 [Erysiphe necator]
MHSPNADYKFEKLFKLYSVPKETRRSCRACSMESPNHVRYFPESGIDRRSIPNGVISNS